MRILFISLEEELRIDMNKVIKLSKLIFLKIHFKMELLPQWRSYLLYLKVDTILWALVIKSN